MNLKTLQKHKMPLLAVAGGIAAYAAFLRNKGPSPAAAAVPVVGLEGGYSPQDMLDFGAGVAGDGLQGQEIGARLGDRGFDLAGAALATAQGVAGAATGSATTTTFALADLLGMIFARSPVPAPTPTLPRAPAPRPPATPAPRPTPAPTLVGYEIRFPPGTYGLFTVDSGGTVRGSRRTPFSRSPFSPAPCRRMTTNGRVTLHWRISAGGLSGWSAIPGQSGGFQVVRKMRRADGRFDYVPISQTGR